MTKAQRRRRTRRRHARHAAKEIARYRNWPCLHCHEPRIEHIGNRCLFDSLPYEKAPPLMYINMNTITGRFSSQHPNLSVLPRSGA